MRFCQTLNLLLVLIICSACRGQNLAPNSTSSETTNGAALGTLVKELPDLANLIYHDQQNNYWFGDKKDLYKYDGKQIIRYTLNDGLPGMEFHSIQEDKSGNLFFDTPHGVCKFDGQSFTTLPVIDNPYSGANWKLEPDDLWFRMGWNKTGPYRYDGQFLYYLEFPKPEQLDSFYAKFPGVSYSPYGIYTIYKDSKGHMWFGTSSIGLCRFDGAVLSWMYEDHLTNTPAGGSFGIRSILEDEKGFFWICNPRYRYEMLPGYYTKNETDYIQYNRETGAAYQKEEATYPYFMSIIEDDKGTLWGTTYEEGVFRKEAQLSGELGERFIYYPVQYGKEKVLVFSMYKDRQGVLWLHTHNAGAFRFNGEAFEKFILNNGH